MQRNKGCKTQFSEFHGLIPIVFKQNKSKAMTTTNFTGTMLNARV